MTKNIARSMPCPLRPVVAASVAATIAALSYSAAAAQQALPAAPAFAANRVNAAMFDAIFDTTVAEWPSWRLLRNQATGARFDAVVCNKDAAVQGQVRVDAGTWSRLDPGVCTYFGNFNLLEFWRPDNEQAWTAKVYLRAKR